MNHDAVEHVSASVGPQLKRGLDAALRSRPPPSALPALVADVLHRTLQQVEDALVADFLALLPQDPAAVARLDPLRARELLNDKSSPNAGYHRTSRAFGGTTALVALVDAARANLWVANVGDCIAGACLISLPRRRSPWGER